LNADDAAVAIVNVLTAAGFLSSPPRRLPATDPGE
jgi:hypothetical protein